MESPVRRLIAALIRRWVARHHVLITVVSLLLTVVSVWVVVTQWNINSDFRALLPRDSPATRALESVESRLGSATAMFVVVDSPSFEANRRFARDFARRLRAMDEVALAHFHNDRQFFVDHQLLYMEAEDLRTLRTRLQQAIREAKKRANPFYVPLSEGAAPSVRTEDLEEKYAGQLQRYKEYLISEDRRSLTIVVRFTEAAADFEAVDALLGRIKRTARQLGPTGYHPDMEVDYGGGLVSRQQEYRSILDDVRFSAFGEIAVLLVLIALFFRRVRAVALVFLPLLMGVAWTLALGFVWFGELTTISVFIFAILLGLGIDFSLHILNSYDRHRMEGHEPVEALVECYMSTGRATLVGGTTTIATFLVLAFAEFRGVSQFGQLAAAGILLSLVTMMVTLPALVLNFQAVWPHRVRSRRADEEDRRRGGWIGRLLPERVRPKLAWGLLGGTALALIVGSLVFAPNVEFEESYREIGDIHWPWSDQRSRRSQQVGRGAPEGSRPPTGSEVEAETRENAAAVGRHVRNRAASIRRDVAPESFVPDRRQRTTEQKYSSALQGQFSSIPIVLLFENVQDTRRAFDIIETMHRAGQLDAFASVSSIYSFLPGNADRQEARMAEIRRMRELLEREDLSGVGATLRKRIDELRQRLQVEPVELRDLPAWTKRLFKEAGAVAAEPLPGEPFAYQNVIFMVGRVDQLNGPEARRLVGQLDGIRERIQGAGVEDYDIAAEAEAYVALLDEVQTDGVRLILIGLAVVLVILMVAFRHPIRGLISMSSLAFAGLLLFGILGAFGIRLDVYNIVFLTAIIGISVDDDVHLYRRYLDIGPGSIGAAVRWVGPAVAMNALTSGIGFGGLMFTDNAGLRSIGHLAVVGVICSLVSTVIMLPAVLKLAELIGFDQGGMNRSMTS